MNNLLSCLGFLISPLIAVLVSFCQIAANKERQENYYTFIILAGMLLGVINAGKLIENDLASYYNWFHDVPNYSVSEYIRYKGKEPAFFLLNYILYYLTVGNFSLYLITYTALCYSILGAAIYRLHLAVNYSRYTFITALIVLFLFPNLFSLSAHLMRQFLAASILCFICIEISYYKKPNYLLFFLASLIHTSSVIFAVIYALNKVRNNKIITYLLIALLTTFMFFIVKNPQLFSYLSFDNEFVSYGISRFQKIDQSYVELGSFSALNFALFSFIILVFYKSSQSLQQSNRILFGLSLTLLTFILLNIDNSEVSMRFSFYLYVFLPIATYLFLGELKFSQGKYTGLAILMTCAGVLGSWLAVKINTGAWEYHDIERILFIGFWL